MQKNLIKYIKRGDKKALKEVFDVYFHSLSAFGYKFVHDRDAVKDMVQEAYIAFWDKRQDFDHLPAIKSFLYTSVRNKCLNYVKHQDVRRKHEASLVYELESDHRFSHHVVEEETFNQLLLEIKELPEAAREIMILALNGLKNQEIADELNISINTVKTQKKIAYSKLKQKMEPRFETLLLSLLW